MTEYAYFTYNLPLRAAIQVYFEPSMNPNPANTVSTDILVIGGGPGGSAAATFLARKGWKVTLIEKSEHPRFHIGESLLPMNIPILEKLGVLEHVRKIGLLKLAADFPSQDGQYHSFKFDRALSPKSNYAFQVRRSEFDQLLFEHARDNGVTCLENCLAKDITFDAQGRPESVHALHAGEHVTFNMRYVVDASGRDTFLGNKLKLKVKNQRHQSASIFSHYKNVVRHAGDAEGNISIYRLPKGGWSWIIPLADGITSIGIVCPPELLKTRGNDTASFLEHTLRSSADIGKRIEHAERVAPVHATGNYSYDCTRMAGPGWMLVGDAYAFIDPIFSSGVFLAMYSAELGADVIDQALKHPEKESKLQHAMQTALRNGVDHLKWFIYRFNTPALKTLFADPQNTFKIEQGVISMLAGDVFDNSAVRRRLRAFRMIYAITDIMLRRKNKHLARGMAHPTDIVFEGETLHKDEL